MTSIASWITRRAERSPDSVALVDAHSGESFSYAEIAGRVARRAGTLRALGVRQGDRVMVVSMNSVEMIEVVFATARIGAITVPVNFRLSADEIAYLITDARPSVVVHDHSFAGLSADAIEASALNVPATHVDDLLSDAEPAEEAPLHPDDVAMIMYTSGTTGRPQGAMLTHRNFEANAVNMMTAGQGITPVDSSLAVAPLFHIGGLGLYTLPVLFAGGRVVVQSTFDPERTLELLAEHRITLHFMVPAMWDAMLKVPGFDDHDLSALRCLLCGGAPSVPRSGPRW